MLPSAESSTQPADGGPSRLARLVHRLLGVRSIRCLQRALAGIVVATLLLSAPMAAVPRANHLECGAEHHECDASLISSCCCPDQGSSETAATLDRQVQPVPGSQAPAALLPRTAATTTSVAVPSQSWLRGALRRAGPPLALSVLHSSFLI